MWTVAQPYSQDPMFNAAFSWVTTGLASGTYHFSVWARDVSSAGTSCNSLGCSDAFVPGFTYFLGSPPCTSVTDSAAPPSPQPTGAAVTLTANAVGCSSPQYQFWMLAPGSSAWAIAQAYSNLATFNWTTTGKPGGTYYFSVWARDAGSAGTSCNSLGCSDAFVPGFKYVLTSTPCASVTASAVPVSTAARGTTVVITGNASGCPNALYEFWILAPGGTWTVAQGYSTSATFNWTTTGLAAGTYRFSVWVRDASSSGSSCSSLGCNDAFAPGTVYTLT
jgi:cell wall-associated protease